jgi:ring-1,2-phenylacetyl-CoA epoxidase subunit PaaE
MSQFHSLQISAKHAEGTRAVALSMTVPPDLTDAFKASPGQHVVLRAVFDGQEQRRTYSLCSDPGAATLNICVRSDGGGRMTQYLLNQVQVGSSIDVYPPTGRFLLPAGTDGANYLAVAAGVGITPVLAIVTSILESKPHARVTLLYGNRSTESALFADALQALKDRYLSRLSLHFFMSREEQDLDIYQGRIDAQKLRAIAAGGFDVATLDAAFLCAPEALMTTLTLSLQELGLPASRIHVERFVTAGATADARTGAVAAGAVTEAAKTARVTVRMDGRAKTFQMPRDGSVTVLDAAEAAGLELPYSCKGGVCSTCRTHLSKGTVQMAQNYALEDSEVDAGFVLTCQSVPTSAELELDYDTR